MNSVERAAPEPSQGGSSLEAKPDEQDRLNVPRLLLNDGHNLPQLGFGVWQIDNADAPEIIGTAIHAGYRLIDTAASGTQRIPRPRAHPPAYRRRRSGRPTAARSGAAAISSINHAIANRVTVSLRGWPSRPAGRRMGGIGNVGALMRCHRSVQCKFDCVFNIPSDFHSHTEEKSEGK
jgi:hypothetical protein